MTNTATAPHTRAYGRAARVRITLVAGAVPALIAIGGAVLMLAWAPQLPDPIAVHWGAGGRPDGYGSLGAMIALVLGIVLVFSAAVTLGLVSGKASAGSSRQGRFLSATSVWLAAFLTGGITGSVAMQRGLTDAATAGSVFPGLIVGAAAGLLLAVGAWFATPLPEIAADSADDAPSALALAAEERAIWTRSVRPATKTVVLLGLLFGGMVVASLAAAALATTPGGWWIVVLVGVVVVASAGCFSWRVSVDSRGLTVRSGAGYPRVAIPLQEIAGARVVQVNPLADFGGWGWRWASGRTGIVVRSGEALEVTRESGRVLVVTVDDAATAVALLEGLRHRDAPSAPPAPA